MTLTATHFWTPWGSMPISAMQSITVAVNGLMSMVWWWEISKAAVCSPLNDNDDDKMYVYEDHDHDKVLTGNLPNTAPALSVRTDSIRSQKGLRLWLKQLKGKKSNSD